MRRIKKTIDDAKVPHGEVELPRGYLFENDNGTVTRYYKAKFRELSGIEEDIIADDDLFPLEQIHKVIGSCMVNIKDENDNPLVIPDKPDFLNSIADDMLMGDDLVSLMVIRLITNGNAYDFESKCSECDLKQQKRIDLLDFEIINTEGDLLNTERCFQLRDGRELVWEMLTGKGQRDYIESLRNKPIVQKGRKRRLKSIEKKTKRNKKKHASTKNLLARVRTIGGEEATLDMLMNLGSPERMKIRNAFEEEGGIELEFDIECNKKTCANVWSGAVDVTDRNFFFPSAI